MRAGRPRSRGDPFPLMGWGDGRVGAGDRYFFMNMDAQDAQDEGLLRGELTPAMIRCGFADAQDYKPAVS